jgi:hypothetical protein
VRSGETGACGNTGQRRVSAGYLFPLAGILRGVRWIGAAFAGSGDIAPEGRVCFVLRLPGFSAAGRFVLLLLLPGEFPLSLLEGEFCSCHGLPPLAFLSFRESSRMKKGRPGAILARRNALCVIPIKLHGFYVFGRRAFLALCDVETDTLALG